MLSLSRNMMNESTFRRSWGVRNWCMLWRRGCVVFVDVVPRAWVKRLLWDSLKKTSGVLMKWWGVLCMATPKCCQRH